MSDIIDGLERLQKLRDSETITDAEFESEKAKILSETSKNEFDDYEPSDDRYSGGHSSSIGIKESVIAGILALAMGWLIFGGDYLSLLRDDEISDEPIESRIDNEMPADSVPDEPKIEYKFEIENEAYQGVFGGIQTRYILKNTSEVPVQLSYVTINKNDRCIAYREFQATRLA